MKQKVTINDIAELCGVSKSSVSRYLNHGYVSKENAEKIRKVIEETGFETNFFASRLKAKHSRLIGIMVADITNKETALTLEGMQRKLSEHGYQGIILLSEHILEKEKECIRSFSQQGVDGIIIVDSSHGKQLKETVETYGVVVLYANQASDYAPFLALEEYKAGEIIAKYLLDRNCRYLLYIGSDERIGEKRKESILKTYENRGQTCDLKSMKCDHNPKSGYDLAKEILQESYEVILCESDELAVNIMKYFHEVHIHVPQNISIVSFGGNQICEMVSPSITSISYHYEAFGANLVEVIIAISKAGIPVWEVCEVQLIERESTNSK